MLVLEDDGKHKDHSYDTFDSERVVILPTVDVFDVPDVSLVCFC